MQTPPTTTKRSTGSHRAGRTVTNARAERNLLHMDAMVELNQITCPKCGETVRQICLDSGIHDIALNPKIAGHWAEFSKSYPSLTDDAYAVTYREMATGWVRALIRDLEMEKERLLKEKSKLEKERFHVKPELRQ